jgi:hypothetical protein
MMLAFSRKEHNNLRGVVRDVLLKIGVRQGSTKPSVPN